MCLWLCRWKKRNKCRQALGTEQTPAHSQQENRDLSPTTERKEINPANNLFEHGSQSFPRTSRLKKKAQCDRHLNFNLVKPRTENPVKSI